MARHTFAYAVFFGCLLVAFADFANADIVQCIDGAGAVTFTDVPCKKSADVVRVSVSADSSSVSGGAALLARSATAAGKIHPSGSVKKPARKRGLALDVATMRAARSSMLLRDQESYLLREQKLAALDQKNQGWFSF